MFRLPHDVLDLEVAEEYCYTDAASLIDSGDHLVVSLFADRDSEDYWDEPGCSAAAACASSRTDISSAMISALWVFITPEAGYVG
jgi:hypothetical protein